MPTSILDPDACRAALVPVIQGVSGVGRVYPYRRLTRNDAEIQALFAQDGVINAWMLAFNATNSALNKKWPGFNAIGSPGGGTVYTTFLFAIEAYYGVSDAADSEETFANLVWLVAQTLNSYGGLAITGLVEQEPCQIVQCTYAMLARKYLTHYAKLTIAMSGRTQ